MFIVATFASLVSSMATPIPRSITPSDIVTQPSMDFLYRPSNFQTNQGYHKIDDGTYFLSNTYGSNKGEQMNKQLVNLDRNIPSNWRNQAYRSHFNGRSRQGITDRPRQLTSPWPTLPSLPSTKIRTSYKIAENQIADEQLLIPKALNLPTTSTTTTSTTISPAVVALHNNRLSRGPHLFPPS